MTDRSSSFSSFSLTQDIVKYNLAPLLDYNSVMALSGVSRYYYEIFQDENFRRNRYNSIQGREQLDPVDDSDTIQNMLQTLLGQVLQPPIQSHIYQRLQTEKL